MSVAEAARKVDLEDTATEQNVIDDDPLEDNDELPALEEQEPQTLTGRLRAPLEGSIQEDRVGELWNPEQGGLNRLVLVVEEVAGFSDGIPRAAHGLIALAEIADSPPEFVESVTGEESEEPEEPNEQASDSTNSDTQEVINHGR